MLATIAGNPREDDGCDGYEDGANIAASFAAPDRMTVDLSGNIMLADECYHALRKVSKAGANVSTLAGNGEEGFADARGAEARFSDPSDVVLTGTGAYAISDTGNHAIRVVTMEESASTLVGNGTKGFADGRRRA